MELHHSKHHQAYVTNLNKALFDLAAAVQANDIDKQITLQSAINFNGGGHINHSLFWQNLAPASSPEASRPEESAPSLLAEISQTWGSLDAFKQAFSAKLLTIQGSGWGWLVKVAGSGNRKPLQIVTTKDQDPVPNTFVPVFGVDMWEHAYYLQVSSHSSTPVKTFESGVLPSLDLLVEMYLTLLRQYLNGKAAYVENIWKIINWRTAEERFLGARADAFKVLQASLGSGQSL